PGGASNNPTATTHEPTPPQPQASQLPSATEKKAGLFEIAVAAFRTERRAAEVSAAVHALGLPVSTRSTAGGVWYQVVVGPFVTADEADTARQTLAREGFGDTRVSTVVDERR